MTSVNLSADGIEYASNPSTDYTITVTANGRTHTVRGNVNAWWYAETDKDADNFMKFIDFMYRIFDDEADNQNLPEAVGGYE